MNRIKKFTFLQIFTSIFEKQEPPSYASVARTTLEYLTLHFYHMLI